MDKLIGNIIRLFFSLIFALISFFIRLFSALFSHGLSKKSKKARELNISYHEDFDEYNTGNPTKTNDGGWILNPKSTFPLTTYGLNENQVNNLKKYLDEYYSSGSRNIIYSILPTISCHGFSCKEIEDYINEYKPKYLEQVEKLIISSEEWEVASEEEREELLDEFRSDALEYIDKQPYCDFLTLFNVDEKNISEVQEIISIYGYENLICYFKNIKKIDKLHILKTNDNNKETFERLVSSGLAIKNEDIQLQTILEKVKLKEINDILYGKIEKPFRRKEDAIEFIIQSSDVKHNVKKIFISYQFYKFKPLFFESSKIDYNKFKDVNEYFSEVADLIAHTYIMGGMAAKHKAQSKNLSRISGWKVSPVNDGSTCKFCQRISKKSYPKNQYPKVPLHIGCRCGVFPKMK